jgi:hypothetical protein
MELLASLASIVAPPRFPLWRYHGVIAPASPWRSRIVPRSALVEPCTHVVKPKHDAGAACGRKFDPSTVRVSMPTSPERSWRASTSYVSWAELLRHCFDIDILDCPNCHSRLAPVATITRQETIDRILSHLSLPLRPEPLGPADTVAYDVTGEPMLDWVVGVDPEPDARAPPSEWDGVDPPAPED